MPGPEHQQFAELNLGGRYEILKDVRGSDELRMRLGTKGTCRYCGCTNPSKFRNEAHTFPEALNNKWVISLDECDDCNALFSLYEAALASAVSPFLTLGGVKGKRNKTRQTGRTGGASVLERRIGADRPHIFASMIFDEKKRILSVNPITGQMKFAIDIASVPFRPRHAYKALAKMAFALLPDEELCNYRKLQAWLLDVDDNEDFSCLAVAMSFAAVGNALPLVAGTLLRRVRANDLVPHIIFIFCAGSVCFQIDLLSDHKEDHIPPVPHGSINIQYSLVIGSSHEDGRAVKIDYGAPVHLNWSATETEPQPIKAMLFDFDPKTCRGNFTPIFR